MAKINKSTYQRLTVYRDYLADQNYKERPVDIITFITDSRYLGASTGNGQMVFGRWKSELKNIFLDNAAYQVVFTGGIGIGKTYIGCIGMAYVMYLTLCLRNPWKFYNKADGGKIAVVFFNLTKTLGQSKGFNNLQNFLMKSEWFRQRGTIRGEKDLRVEFDELEYVLASPNARGFGTQGISLCTGLLDELDSPMDSENSKNRVLKAYESTVRRLETRFTANNKSHGKLFLVASKQDTMGFLNTFVEKMKASSRVYVVDMPQWEASAGSNNYCGKTFKISLGDDFTAPKMLHTEEDVKQAKLGGFEVLEIPIEFEEDFTNDIIGAIRDIAGKAVKGTRKGKLFPSEKFIDECFDLTRQNPVTVETIEIGLKDDHIDFINFIDFSKVTASKHLPRYIHCDIAFSGDALGLSMACINGYKEVTQQTQDGQYHVARAPIAWVDFVLRIKAKQGDVIPLHKIRKLIFDLRDRGFRIAKYTSDLKLASEDTLQLLKSGGIEAAYFSVDRPIDVYVDFRNLVLENRWNCFKHDYLKFEMKNLEWDRVAGKIDHPDEVKDIVITENGDVKDVILTGSKDLSDSCCGACISALREETPPMDIEGMQKLITAAAHSPNSAADDLVSRMMPDVGGSKIIGQMNNGNLEEFANLLRGM